MNWFQLVSVTKLFFFIIVNIISDYSKSKGYLGHKFLIYLIMNIYYGHHSFAMKFLCKTPNIIYVYEEVFHRKAF